MAEEAQSSEAPSFVSEASESPSSPSSSSEPESAADRDRRYALLRSVRKEGGAEQFVQSISQQLLLQHDANWGDLLGAAPQALCFLGQCFVATTSSIAISSLELPEASVLKYNLRDKRLRPNLVHCSDLGRKAFSDAESKMHKVHLVATHICEPRGPIDKILGLIDDDELARLDLQRQLDRLKKYSEDCVKDSAQVRDKFARWQEYATQLRLACTAADNEMESKQLEVKDNIFIAASISEHQQKETERTEQNTANARSHVEVHQEVYQREAKAMPRGWNLLAQDTATRAINLLPDLISMARAAGPWAMLAGGIKPREDYQEPDAPGVPNHLMPNPHDDYGYRVSRKISKQLHSLNAQLNRGELRPPDYGVDWNSLHGFSSPGLGNSLDASIDRALGVFRQAREQAPAMLGQPESKSSSEATEILETVIEFCEEIQANKEAQRSFNVPPPRDPGMIRRWRETARSMCDRNDLLEKQFAEMEVEHTDYMQNLKESGSKRKKSKKGMSGILSKNNVQIARENYQAAQKALVESENLLAERAEREAEAKRKFNEVQLQLAKLNNENMNMQEIIGILQKCIANLTEFQAHLGNLVTFFSELNTFIDVIHNGPALEFLNQTNNIMILDQNAVQGDQEQRRARKRAHKDSLLLDALNLRGNYLVAGELASVYYDISRKHIMPGVNAIERLGLRSTEDSSQTTSAEKARQILTYARKAQSEISKMAQERRNRLREELYIQDREITEIGRLVENAQLEDVEDSDYENDEWDEA